MNKITVFNAQKNKTNKVAYSVYDDNTFVFETYDSDNNLQMFNVLVSHWTLNIPLEKITERIRTFRRKVNLEPYYGNELTYFILDIDKVESLENRDHVLEYFKQYKCILGESKSYNGTTNFNMKGIIFVEPVEIQSAKSCIQNINHTLKEYCDIDEAVARKATLNAPIGKNEVLLNSEGELYKCTLEIKHINSVEDGYVDITKKEKTKVDLNDVQGETIEEYCVNIFKNMGFEPIKHNENSSITFKHPSEEKSVGGYFWFENSPYTMHHPNSTRTINIFDAVKRSEVGKALMKVELNYDDAFLQFDTNTKVIDVEERYLTMDGKEGIIKDWLEEKEGLFSIKSPMGTGKSTVIKYIIEQSHELDMRVLIITNRRSVAADFAKKYNMKVYNKDMYNLGDSLIVQYDSLWKYNIKDFDIVIMDEFISLMTHSRNNLGNSSLNIAKFFGAFNKKLVIADAFLTGYENFLLQNKKTNIVQLNNTWRDKTVLYSYHCSNYFIDSLALHAQKHKITVSATSLNFLNSTRAMLEKRGLKVVLLTAETPDSTKELIYELFEKEEHDKWDVFMYSPTLTVGVSNLNNVPYHFHYDSSMSTDVISSIQMIKRTRKAKEIHMFIAERTTYLKVTYNAVRDEYMGNMGRNIDQNYLFDIDDYGEAKLSKIGRNAVKIDTFKNIMEFNHKQGMFWMLKYHFFHEPREVTKTFESNMLAGYNKALRNDKSLALQSSINEFLSLNDIEKTDILLDTDDTKEQNKLMKVLIEIDEHIKPMTNNKIRTEILNIALKNKLFVKQCSYYGTTIDYVRKFTVLDDIKVKVSQAVIKSHNDDLIFYNQLIRYGQVPFEVQYKYKPKDKLLIYMLDKIGYKMGSQGIITDVKDIGLMSEVEKRQHMDNSKRVFRLDPNIKEYYGYMK